MSIEKALEYLNCVDSKKTAIDSLVRSFSLLPDIPESIWIEFFSGLDYSIILNSIADKMSSSLTDNELDRLLEMAKDPVFQKHLNIYPELLNTLKNDAFIWLNNVKNSGELLRLENILIKNGTSEDVIDFVISSFDFNESEFENVSGNGSGN